MHSKVVWKVLLPILIVLVELSLQAKKQKTPVVSDITNIKEFKKLLRTKTNVLVLFVNDAKASQPTFEVFKNTADAMKGQATLVVIECSNSEGKKLCLKLKVGTDKPYLMKHYKDGEYHKDYDRSETVNSMSNFLRDPTGDLPWEEDPDATDIYHLADGEALTKFLKKGVGAHKNSMIMFYAPWCGFCKTMKPDYVQAATDLKGEALLAAIDTAKPVNSKLRQLYNITGFPTLYYYEKGQFRFPYNGENKRQAIVDFMRDPSSQQTKKKQPVEESWSEDSDVVHLTDSLEDNSRTAEVKQAIEKITDLDQKDMMKTQNQYLEELSSLTESNFDSVIAKAEHALVVFYAPWCGHCKRIKPEFEKAAARIKKEKINGLLAAVDATKQPELGSRFGVKGYPTLKYFNKGEYKFDAGHARQEDQIVSFIKEPSEPPPPPPAEKPWAEEESAVRHLHSETFRLALRKVKHAIVMFYAPWCGHCKSTKPEFVKAAEAFADELMVAFGAVDCTTEVDVCKNYDVKGYPTIKYFSYFDKSISDYTGGRKEADFVSFIHGQMSRDKTSQSAAAATPQAAGFGGNVRLAFDSDFDQIIADSKPTFIMFYASWCGHCTASKPIFSRLATTAKESNLPLNVIAIDAAENPKVADIAGIQTLPTFKIFANGKEVAVYDGDRSMEDMLKFCQSHFKVKDEL